MRLLLKRLCRGSLTVGNRQQVIVTCVFVLVSRGLRLPASLTRL